MFEKVCNLLKKKTVSNVIEKLVEQCIHCLPCSYTNDTIDLSSEQLCRRIDVKLRYRDDILPKGSVKHLMMP